MAKKKTTPRRVRDKGPRFGIGEWFGMPLEALSPADRQAYGAEQLVGKDLRQAHPCPFQAGRGNPACNKAGGVCSLKLYEYGENVQADGTVRLMGTPVAGDKGELRATCPYRFHEASDVFKWVGEIILDDPAPEMVGEVGFLEATSTTDSEGGDDVGRIDMVLVKQNAPAGHPLQWCAVEIQAVYFSGTAMTGEFKAYADPTVSWITFPVGQRRPDYRSSGPKRLMPQLQIKVPTLRRWGKKMAVVVDRSFFNSIGHMDEVADISNADIAWFVVRFDETAGEAAKLVRDHVRFTTLERSVEGLTGGLPVSLKEFEVRITKKEARGGAASDETSLDVVEREIVPDASANIDAEQTENSLSDE